MLFFVAVFVKMLLVEMAVDVLVEMLFFVAVSVEILSMGVAVDVLVDDALLRGRVRENAPHGRGCDQDCGL